MTPASPASANAATIRSACAIASARRREGLVDDRAPGPGGWRACRKSRRAPRRRIRAAALRGRGNRCRPCRSPATPAAAAPKRRGCARARTGSVQSPSSRVASAPMSAARSSAPQVEAGEPRARARIGAEPEDRGGGFRGDRDDARRAVGDAVQRLAHREPRIEERDVGAAGRLRQHDAVGRAGHDHVEVAVGKRRRKRIDAHIEAAAAPARSRLFLQEGEGGAPRRLLARRRRPNPPGRGSARRRRSASAFSSFSGLSPGTKSSERIRRRRFFMKAWRRQIATSTSCWLKHLCSNSTMPASGRDFDSRLRHTSVVTCTVSPWKSGLGKRTSRHAEIGDGRADRRVVDGDADHQAEREERVHQRLAPFGLGLADSAGRYGAAAG